MKYYISDFFDCFLQMSEVSKKTSSQISFALHLFSLRSCLTAFFCFHATSALTISLKIIRFSLKNTTSSSQIKTKRSTLRKIISCLRRRQTDGTENECVEPRASNETLSAVLLLLCAYKRRVLINSYLRRPRHIWETFYMTTPIVRSPRERRLNATKREYSLTANLVSVRVFYSIQHRILDPIVK